MKRIIYLFFLLSLSGIANYSFAQIPNAPVLISSNAPDYGYKAYYVAWDTTGVDPGAGGANLTWDFSKDLTDLGTVDSGNYLQVISPYSASGDSFPSSNICIEQHVNSNVGYLFFILSDLGFVDTAESSAQGTKVYSTNKVELEFPMTYPETITTISQVVGQSTELDTIIYDAYGTLITPFATFTNVARIYYGSSGGSEQYQWWSTDPIFPILTLDLTDNGSSYFIPQTALGISQVNNVQSIKVSPNPSSEASILSFNLNKDASVNISMFDISGREVQQIFSGDLNAGLNQMQVDNANISPGMYFISVLANGQSERVKYIKL